jgi:hypothetical protein
MNRNILYFAPVLMLSLVGHITAGEPVAVKYAILVGVTDYDHPRFRTLKYAENDVSELGQKLRAGGFRVTQLSKTVGERNARFKPTRANILHELDSVLNAATKRDMVFIALSGHGLQPSGSKESFFCPSDARAQDLNTLIGLADLYDRLDRSAAEVKLLLADACRDDPAAGKGITNVPLPPAGVGVLLSCSPGEQSYEHKSLKHGVFFHYLLEGLNRRGNDEGEITFGQLAEYVQRKVARTVPKLIGDGATQSPNLVVNISGESPVLLKSNSRVQVANRIDINGNKSDIATKSAAIIPTSADLVGCWTRNESTAIYFRTDGTFACWTGNLYVPGTYTCVNGLMSLAFNKSAIWKGAIA